MFGNGGMGFGGMGSGMMGGMGIWGILMMLLIVVVLVLLIVWIVRTVVNASGGNAARVVLDQRYARGELTRKEYEQMKKDITS